MAGWFNTALNILLPPACVSCRQSGTWWCASCASQVTPCSGAVAGESGSLTGIVAGTYFREPLAAAVKALKYRHARAVGAELVRYLEPPLARIDAPNILLVPIPLHASRQRKRGHNQSAVLAELLSRRSGVPWRNAVRRTRATRTQTELHRRERFANVAGAFEWNGPPPHGQSIVLVDDVVTTGATFEAAASACRAAGASAVWGLAVAYRERG